jgi:hypothetical protein
MIERKNKFVRIRVIGGSGIFDSIVNILKKPAVSKMLTSAGKSIASALGERLVNSMMPRPDGLAPVAPAPTPTPAPAPAPASAPAPATPQQQSRVQQLINTYGANHAGAGMSMQAGGTITLPEYNKIHKGGVIKLLN